LDTCVRERSWPATNEIPPNIFMPTGWQLGMRPLDVPRMRAPAILWVETAFGWRTHVGDSFCSKPAEWDQAVLGAIEEGFQEESPAAFHSWHAGRVSRVLSCGPEPFLGYRPLPRLSPDGRFRYLGGNLPLFFARDSSDACRPIGTSAVRCVPGARLSRGGLGTRRNALYRRQVPRFSTSNVLRRPQGA